MTDLPLTALADPNRRRVVALLARGDRCVRDLLGEFVGTGRAPATPGEAGCMTRGQGWITRTLAILQRRKR